MQSSFSRPCGTQFFGSSWLYGRHRHQRQVVYQADFLLDERLGITNAAQQAVVPGQREGPFANLIVGHKECSTGRLIGILRAVGEQSAKALFDEGRDVDYETGPYIRVEAGIHDLEGPERWLAGINLGQTGEKAGLV